jgi:hypothetical protein
LPQYATSDRGTEPTQGPDVVAPEQTLEDELAALTSTAPAEPTALWPDRSHPKGAELAESATPRSAVATRTAGATRGLEARPARNLPPSAWRGFTQANLFEHSSGVAVAVAVPRGSADQNFPRSASSDVVGQATFPASVSVAATATPHKTTYGEETRPEPAISSLASTSPAQALTPEKEGLSSTKTPAVPFVIPRRAERVGAQQFVLGEAPLGDSLVSHNTTELESPLTL